MLYAVIFEDNTGLGDDVRVAHMGDHLTFLERHAGEIMAAGPLREASGTPVGGLWLVKANARSSVEALIKEDPFWPTGLRASVRILAWQQVFADGRRLI